MSKVEISVIIPTYNSLELLRRTLDCLGKQAPSTHFFQTVVVDDSSTDGTSEFLRTYQGELTLDSVLFQENRGRAATRNAGVSQAESDLLLFIDGDMEFDSNLVAGHLSKHTDREHQVVLGRVVYDRSLPYRSWQRYLESRGANKLPPGNPLPGRYFLSGHVSMPKSIFDDAGGFDESFRAHGGEDLDLGMKIVSRGGKIIYAPELEMRHLHIRKLSDVLSMSRCYGRESVPVLVDKHPELITQLKLDWLDKSRNFGLFRRFILSQPVYWLALAIGIVLNRLRAPAILYDYLLFRNYFRGYREAVDSV